MTPFQARLVSVAKETKPDEYIQGSGRPAADFVVTRKVEGDPASVYGDLVWDFSAYHPEHKTSLLYFDCWEAVPISKEQLALIDEAKWIIFLLMYMKRGVPLSYGTMYNHLKVLKHLMRSCLDKSWQISEVLNDSARISAALTNHSDKASIVAAILDFLFHLGPDTVGYEVAGSKTIRALQGIYATYADESIKQHAPIPTRIYSEIISQTTQFIKNFEQLSDKVLELTAEILQSRVALDANQARVDGPLRFTDQRVAEVTQQLGLTQYFNERQANLTIRGLSFILSEVLLAIRLQVQLFSGMRTSEVSALRYDCLKSEQHGGRSHYLISGRTTKLNHGQKKTTSWVTSESGFNAISLARKIAKVLYGGIVPEDGFLFINPLIMQNQAKPILPAALAPRYFPALMLALTPLIIEDDVIELEFIDPHRPWRTEAEYQIGVPWPLRGHQFRRSLALYAQRSGLVTLPSLKRQLQHITEEMTQYYARGSETARSFIGNQPGHIGKEWQEQQPVSQYLGYVANVLLADDTLFGGHANWVKVQMPSENGIIIHDREITLDRFKNGQMAYRETAIGGCVNTGTCDSGLLDVLDISCLKKNCRNLIVNTKKLERAIAVQTKRVALLTEVMPDSPELRSERADLAVLIESKATV